MVLNLHTGSQEAPGRLLGRLLLLGKGLSPLRHGQCKPIGGYMLKQACRQLHRHWSTTTACCAGQAIFCAWMHQAVAHVLST